jgi:hypothetical protein
VKLCPTARRKLPPINVDCISRVRLLDLFGFGATISERVNRVSSSRVFPINTSTGRAVDCFEIFFPSRRRRNDFSRYFRITKKFFFARFRNKTGAMRRKKNIPS